MCDILRIPQNELAGEQFDGNEPFVVGHERMVSAVTYMRLKWQQANPDIG